MSKQRSFSRHSREINLIKLKALLLLLSISFQYQVRRIRIALHLIFQKSKLALRFVIHELHILRVALLNLEQPIPQSQLFS